ncbi:MAG: serine hydrolase domain-containing protein [Lysobacterales bacterium]|jgi:beta-lactamase class C
MNRRWLAGIALFLLVAAPAARAADLRTEALVDTFDSHFRQLVTRENIPGAAYAIVSPKGPVRIEVTGYTDTKKRRPVGKNTVFRIASVSKTFAGGLAGLLENEGSFSWDDRLQEHVPGFTIAGDASLIHVSHVVGQSSGLIPHAYDNYIEDGFPLDRILEKFRGLDYLCEPGTCYSYQNVLFSLIGTVVEHSTSSGYAELMRERIFEPLGMKNASVGLEPLLENPDHARPHVKSRGAWRPVDVEPNYYRVAPAAGVNASIDDLSHWLMAQMGAYPDVLPPAVVETVSTPRVRTARDLRRRHWRDLISDAHYGLGWRIYTIDEEQIVYHGGWVRGFRADIAWSKNHEIGIAILMNAENRDIGELTTAFWREAFASFKASSPAKTADPAAGLSVRTPPAARGSTP